MVPQPTHVLLYLLHAQWLHLLVLLLLIIIATSLHIQYIERDMMVSPLTIIKVL